jgi:hypothetical protein
MFLSLVCLFAFAVFVVAKNTDVVGGISKEELAKIHRMVLRAGTPITEEASTGHLRTESSFFDKVIFH